MRKFFFLIALAVFLSESAFAQIGKRVALRAGTPEDRAYSEILNTTDPAKKIALLEKFLADFGQGEMALLAYEVYLNHYAAEKNYDKAFEYGEKILSLDPDQFNAAATLVRLAQEKGDTERLLAYAERVSALLERFRKSPPREGTDPETWEGQKKIMLSELAEQIRYVEYMMFNVGYQTADPAKKAALLERYLKAFPEGSYASTAPSLIAAAYQQAQNYPKMLEFAQGVLTRDPENLGMLILLADYLSERGEQLDQAEAYATKAMEILAKTEKPAQLSDEQWNQQKSIQRGLALNALGQVHIRKERLPQAEAAFREAGPLLKSDAVTYGRSLYLLGFTLARQKKAAEARTVLQEAVNMKGPYSPLAAETLKKLGPAPAKKRR